ncbi:MAG: prohead protease/major capsid protein fusion protein [Maricaulaceae bacterium]
MTTIDLMRRASAVDFAPTSLNRAARTVEAVVMTATPVARRDHRGGFREVLDAGGVDLNAFAGLPLLDSHKRGSLADQIGVVTNARREGDRIVATLRLSSRSDALLDDIEAGVIRGVSLGYRINKTRERRSSDGLREVHVVDLTPVEVSIVPIPADPQSTFRSQSMSDVQDVSPPVAPAAVQTRAEINTAIRRLAEAAGVRATADDLVDREATLDEARAAILDAVVAKPTVRAPAIVTRDENDPHQRAQAMGEAIYTRINPRHKPSDLARPHMGLSLSELARDSVRAAGLSTTGLSAETVVQRALHSTSDFPQALGDAVGRELRTAYQAVPSGLKAAARQASVPDFRKRSRIQVSGAPSLEKVNEAGEFKSGSMFESGEAYGVETFGRIVAITRQVIVNDDLGWTADIARRLGQAAADFEAQSLVALLEGASGAGPTLSDGVALFHADHGNLASSGAALSETTLSAARLALRSQTGLAGERIAATPKYLIVPPALETAAEKLLAAITPASSEDVNVFAGRLMLIVEPRLASETRWYVTADPAQIDGLEYAYLAGAEGPQIESRAGFEVDGVQMRVRLDFGAGFIDHRGWFANPGA